MYIHGGGDCFSDFVYSYMLYTVFSDFSQQKDKKGPLMFSCKSVTFDLSSMTVIPLNCSVMVTLGR